MSVELDYQEHLMRATRAINSAHMALRPPKRLTVAQGASDVLMVYQPGIAAKPWSAEETPYMVEPMNMLASRVHQAVCFVGPARSGKTMAFTDAWAAHNIANDSGDMMVVQMSQDKAREFSKTRVDRMLLHSPKLQAFLSRFAVDDNTHDKRFRHGMWLRLAWPTATNLSGSDYRYVSIPDYDRTPDDVNKEGSKYSLALKRTETFMSRGMLAVESSPGRPIVDPNWKASTLHEAPAVGGEDGTGILGIYNMGDRRRWYWKCFDCKAWFEAAPGLNLFRLPDENQLIEMVREMDIVKYVAEHDHIYCPHCSAPIQAKHKAELNRRSLGLGWLQDGQYRDKHDELHGDPQSSTLASYWLGGVAAAYQPWRSILSKYLQALRDYAISGSEQTLKTVTNTDQAMPYMSRHLIETQKRHRDPSEREDSGLQRYVVPEWTRTVIVAVDVQGGSTARFVVQAHAIGAHAEQALIDRYEIKQSMRPGMGEEFAPVDPSRYVEDWHVLTEKIIRSTFRTPTLNREIRVKLLVVDCAGEEGVYDKALDWYREIRREGYANRVMLSKGNNIMTDWLIKETMVGKRGPGDTPDCKLFLINTHLISDMVMTGVRRDTPGPGYIHFPPIRHPRTNPQGYITQAFFDELNAEVRGEDGKYRQIRARNETHDLCRMIRAGCLRLGLDKIADWNDLSALPTWLHPLDSNSECITSDERRAMKENARIVESAAPTEGRVVPKGFQRRRAVPSF